MFNASIGLEEDEKGKDSRKKFSRAQKKESAIETYCRRILKVPINKSRDFFGIYRYDFWTLDRNKGHLVTYGLPLDIFLHQVKRFLTL